MTVYTSPCWYLSGFAIASSVPQRAPVHARPSPSNGKVAAAVTAVTPGSADRRCCTKRIHAFRALGSRSNFCAVNSRTPLESNPGSTCVIAMKLRSMRPLPMSSTNASVTSAIATPLRSAPPPDPALRPLARSANMRSGREARSAGTTPNSATASRLASTVNASTCVSMLTSPTRGRCAGPIARRRSMPPCDSTSPSAAPLPASTSASASIWRMRRERLPPIAARTASSRSRRDVRTSMRLATFAHAISRTNMTPPMSARTADFTSPTSSACSGSIRSSLPDVSRPGNRASKSLFIC